MHTPVVTSGSGPGATRDLAVAAMAPDRLGRALRDVRISLTDRCNFRCSYCMPRSAFGPGHAFLPRDEILSAAEVITLGATLVRLGVRKIRLTGGEPLLRHDLEEIVVGLSSTGVADLALTTNGSLLESWAPRLRAAGLHRVTVSLDTLDPLVHARLSDTGTPLQSVLDGIRAAGAAGFAPIRLNAVIRRGINDTSIEALAGFARDNGHVLRFIEYMDVGASNHWTPTDVTSGAEIAARVSAHHRLLDPQREDPADVAETFRYADGRGEIGVIASVTQPFCGACTRLRISADGRLYTCLFASRGTDLRTTLRNGDEADLERLLRRTWVARSDRYSEERAEQSGTAGRIEMSYIGG